MSLTCKLPQFSRRLPANLTLKKNKESNCVKKWRRKVLFFWTFGGFACIVIVLWLLLGFNGGRQTEVGSCDGKARMLFIHRNVSRDEVYALASLFSDSDQVTSFKCSKESSLETLANSGMTCALETFCSEKQETESFHRRVAELVRPEAQYFIQGARVPWKFDPSVFRHFVSSAALMCKNLEQNLLQSRVSKDDDKVQCEILSFNLTRGWWCLLVGILASFKISSLLSKSPKEEKEKIPPSQPIAQQRLSLLQQKQQQQRAQTPSRGAGRWRKKLLILFVFVGILTSIWLFWHLNEKIILRRKETLANMCDERARMLQDQFNVSMNHVHALAILVSTFHHGKSPSAMDQKTFGEYTERTNFERPLTSGVAYALKVLHSEREQFERKHGWTIKKMETEDQTLVQDCVPENLDPAPVQDEYAPVIFSQETVSHIVSIDMMSGKEDHENILRARATGKGVLTSPFKLLKSNHLGVVLTFAVYNTNLLHDATEEQRIQATVGYLGASYDVPSLVEKLLHQLASKQTIVVNVYDTTDASAPIKMYGSEVGDKSQQHISNLDFGDPLRKHEMHCWFKQKPPAPWTAIISSAGFLVITLLVGHIFYAAINRIAKVEEDCQKMMELKARAEAADVAKSQFLATVSHEIRTPMNGVLGMLQMLMDTDLDANQMDYAETAHASGKDLISLINEVLDQAKIESGRLELENVPFDLRFVLDNVLLSSGKSNEKGIELAVYVSSQVPEVLIGDPGRFRQIITNLVGNSIKFTHDKGHIFVSVHLADEVRGFPDVSDEVLKRRLGLAVESSGQACDTLSGYPVVNTWRSWRQFRTFNSAGNHGPEKTELLVTIEDTGVGIPLEAQDRIFTPFMQADSSTSRTYGGTGIGLSISKCLVELMQGEIGFVSELGTGSTFSFTGIFGKADAKSSVTKWQQHDPAVQEFKGSRALVIDSRRVRAEVTRYHLRRLGMSVDITSSVRTACACSSKLANLAVVVIDKDAWNKEDFAVFHELLNGSQEISVSLPKIFLLATSTSPVERSELKSSGLVDDVVLKPLRVGVLIGCLQEALGSGKKRQPQKKKRGNLGHLLRAKRILVVDDNLVNRRVAEGALKKYGAFVKCVDSGKAALAMLKPPHDFDACFMDLQMPEMDGFEATRRVRSLEKEINEKIASGESSADMFRHVAHWHVPILAMTADVIQATNEDCMKCGMDDYVAKPFEEEQLYTAVARFFESG